MMQNDTIVQFLHLNLWAILFLNFCKILHFTVRVPAMLQHHLLFKEKNTSTWQIQCVFKLNNHLFQFPQKYAQQIIFKIILCENMLPPYPILIPTAHQSGQKCIEKLLQPPQHYLLYLRHFEEYITFFKYNFYFEDRRTYYSSKKMFDPKKNYFSRSNFCGSKN